MADLHLIHNHSSTKLLHRGNNLLSLVLRHGLLHCLRCALNKFLAVHQAQPQQILDLLDDLGLGARFERCELEGEQGLLLDGRGGLVSVFGGGRCSSRRSSKAADR